jgi:hypothetical protein
MVLGAGWLNFALLLIRPGRVDFCIATLAYAGLPIGEAEQMLWRDVRFDEKGAGMFHVRLGGSNGTTKDKDARTDHFAVSKSMFFAIAVRASSLAGFNGSTFSPGGMMLPFV